MTAPGYEPGGWELHRTLGVIQETLQRIEDKMVPRPEFELHKQELERRFATIDDRLTGTVADKAAAHGKLEQQIEQTRTEFRTAETERVKWSRDVNLRSWLALGGALLAIVGGVVVAAVTHAMGL